MRGPPRTEQKRMLFEIMILKHWVARAAVVLMVGSWAWAGDEVRQAMRYPEAPRLETVDDYHGTKVADPYRPLEDPDAPATRAWIEAENRITFDFLNAIPQRSAIRRRLTELWDFEKFGTPNEEGGRF